MPSAVSIFVLVQSVHLTTFLFHDPLEKFAAHWNASKHPVVRRAGSLFIAAAPNNFRIPEFL